MRAIMNFSSDTSRFFSNLWIVKYNFKDNMVGNLNIKNALINEKNVIYYNFRFIIKKFIIIEGIRLIY